MKRVDVAIIGGSLAGATCARELERFGVDAVAIERDSFPREKVCGGFLSPGAVVILEELNLLGELRSAGAVEIRRARVRFGEVERIFELPRPGLGVSRKTLDAIVAGGANVLQASVRGISGSDEGFVLQLDEGEVSAKVVIDAAGKLTRFTKVRRTAQFGVQFYQPAPGGDVLDFWFFEDGYGGTVTVEGNRSNACFLVRKDALRRYMNKPACLVTGPVGYAREASGRIAIGDAAGMIDPFCGEGMRHAFDSGRIAAKVVAEGLRLGLSYSQMRRQYEAARSLRWSGKRRLAAAVRGLLRYPKVAARGFALGPERVVGLLWGA